MSDGFEWLAEGHGKPPRKRWSFTADAPLSALAVARESGETVAADASGGLYRFDRRGQLAGLTRGFTSLTALAWCDAGGSGFVAVEESRLCRLDRQLKVDWSVELPDPIIGIGTDPFGNGVAVSLTNGHTILFDAMKRRKGEFSTQRPLRYLRYLATEPALIAAAEYGLICRLSLSGDEQWSEKTMANVGDIAATGDGRRLYVAGFTHGIRIFNGSGSPSGAWIVEGTANHLDCSFTPGRVVASTLERHLYWLDADGQMLWGANLPDDAAAVRCDPLGTGLTLALNSGRIISLEWPANA